MRAIIALALLVTPAVALADSYVELAGGLTTPLGDDDWENTVDASPKIALRFGAFPNEIGGFLSADWTPYNADADGFLGADVSAHRFRLLGGVMFHHMVSNTLVVTGRGGLGADIGHASVSSALGEVSDTDTGLGFEMGVGLFFKTGSMEIGGELAIPIAMHDHQGGNGDIAMNYTTYDLDLLFAIRFLQN